jgi:hypothetical protein
MAWGAVCRWRSISNGLGASSAGVPSPSRVRHGSRIANAPRSTPTTRLLPPLPVQNANRAAVQVHVLGVEIKRLRDAQASAVQDGDQGSVGMPMNRSCAGIEQHADLGIGQGSGGKRRLGLRYWTVSGFRRLEIGAVRIAIGCHLLPSRRWSKDHSYLGGDQAIKALRIRVPLKALHPQSAGCYPRCRASSSDQRSYNCFTRSCASCNLRYTVCNRT